MKNLYRLLSLSGPQVTEEAISKAIAKLDRNSELHETATQILLKPNRRLVYDRHWKALTTLGVLRSQIKLTEWKSWDEIGGNEFNPPTPVAKVRDVPRRLMKQFMGLSIVVPVFLLGAVLVVAVETPEWWHSRRVAQAAEDHAWIMAQTRSPKWINSYLSDFKDGKHFSEVNTLYREVAAQRWEQIRNTLDHEALIKFSSDFPKSEYGDKARARLDELNSNIEWVRSQNNRGTWIRYLALLPAGGFTEERAEAEKAIIDLEVSTIMAGKYGRLPVTTPIDAQIGGPFTDIDVENATQWELTVRYSGPVSMQVTVAPNSKKSISLLSGEYRVAASVDATRGRQGSSLYQLLYQVNDFAGTEQLTGGRYSVRYYFQNSR